MKISILLFDGFEEMDAIAPFEVLSAAASFQAPWTLELAVIEPMESVTGVYGLNVRPQAVLDPASPPDLIVVPGGGWLSRAPRSVWTEVQRGVIPRQLGLWHKSGTILAAVCTGTMLLAAAGLVKGRPAITHHSAVEDLRAAGALVTDSRVVDDGELITSGGITSGIDLALHLVARFASKELARRVATHLEYSPRIAL